MMLTQLSTVRSPAILSVRVPPARRRIALVITSSPGTAQIVGDNLRETDDKLTVVWMPTLAAACNRLEWQHADMVVIDSSIPGCDEALSTLHLAAPLAKVQVLAAVA